VKFNGAETRKFPRLCITPPSIYCRAQFGDLRTGRKPGGVENLAAPPGDRTDFDPPRRRCSGDAEWLTMLQPTSV